MAKAPEPGRVKTRMVPPLDPQQAAGLYAAMLRDVLRNTARFAEELGFSLQLAVYPPEARASMARSVPTQFSVVPQRGSDLASRMGWAIREALATGARRVLLRGSDSPALDAERVHQAARALDSCELAICPDRDGGYNLIGVDREVPGLFKHPMSTRQVLEDTLANARALGLHSTVLEPCFDLDRAADLRHLAGVRSPELRELCGETLAHCDDAGLWRLVDR